jgi:hypothetical protein
MTMDPEKVVATFDSASELHSALVAALEQRPFPHLGNSELYAAAVRAAGQLPWPILRRLYTRVGAAEAIPARKLDQVDLEEVAESFTAPFTDRYPAAVIGSSNGAVTHLAAAMGAPWLPQTVLVPVHHKGDAERPDEALDFGVRHAPALLDRNPGIALHQMHDSSQDALMVTRMAYFRTKWRQLPGAYSRFLSERLLPSAPVFLVEDRSTWPVTRVGDRHVFQTGGRGGLSPAEHLRKPHAPAADDEAPEAEWGADPGFIADARRWCEQTGHPVISLRTDGPQQLAAPVADVLREWTHERGGAGDRLIIPSFVIVDPWRTFQLGSIPFWTYFPVQEALASLDHYLDRTAGYSRMDLLMFQHGVDSPGRATPEQFREVARRHGLEFRLLAVDPKKNPHDIGSMARYGPALDKRPKTGPPWAPLSPEAAIRSLFPSSDLESSNGGT